MSITKKSICIILLFFLACSVFAQDSRLDLTQPEQQKDFLQYLRSTVALLDDKALREMTKGIQLENISDSAKRQLAYKMMKDTAYFKRLSAYFDFLKVLEGKYHISKFSRDEWDEVARFGASHGIYFLSAMRKRNEKTDSIRNIPSYFPTIPLLKVTDTVPSNNFKLKLF